MTTKSSSFVQSAIPKFDGRYDHWSMLMENFLRTKEYWSLVENGVPAAVEDLTVAQKKTFEDQKLKDLKGKEFSVSNTRPFYFGDDSQKGYIKEYMGFIKAKISGYN